MLDEVIRLYDTAIPIVFLEPRHTELGNAKLTICMGWRIPPWQVGMQTEAKRPDDYLEKKFVELNNLLLLTFPGGG